MIQVSMIEEPSRSVPNAVADETVLACGPDCEWKSGKIRCVRSAMAMFHRTVGNRQVFIDFWPCPAWP